MLAVSLQSPSRIPGSRRRAPVVEIVWKLELRGRLDYAEQAHLINPFVLGERTSRRSIDGRLLVVPRGLA